MHRCLFVLLAALWTTGASAQSCSEIRFAPGTSSGVVSGRVTDAQPLCFTFGSGAGQTARLQLSGSDNACFSISGVVDCQSDYSFGTRQQVYQVGVFQLFPRGGAEQFNLQLTIR